MAFGHNKGITYLQLNGHTQLLIFSGVVQMHRVQIGQKYFIYYASVMFFTETHLYNQHLWTSLSCQNHLQQQILCSVQFTAHPVDAEISRFAAAQG